MIRHSIEIVMATAGIYAVIGCIFTVAEALVSL